MLAVGSVAMDLLSRRILASTAAAAAVALEPAEYRICYDAILGLASEGCCRDNDSDISIVDNG